MRLRRGPLRREVRFRSRNRIENDSEVSPIEGSQDKANWRSLAPLVAKVCLHIGFCTLRSHLDEMSQGEQLAVEEFPCLISIFKATALAMCAEAEPRCLFAIVRVNAI
jgi:hypothetical protein